MDVNIILASRHCLRSLSCWNVDPVFGHCHVPRLLSDQLARDSHGYRCYHLGLGGQYLGLKDNARVPKRYVGRPRLRVSGHHHCLLGLVTQGYCGSYFHTVHQHWQLELNRIGTHGRTDLSYLCLHLYVQSTLLSYLGMLTYV